MAAGEKRDRRYKHWITAGLGLFGAIVVGFAVEKFFLVPFFAPPTPRVVVTGPENLALWMQVAAGVDAASADMTNEVLVDYRDNDQSEAKAIQIAEELVLDRDVLAVIGPASSTLAKAAIEVYRDSDLPVVLPTATHPPLLDKTGHIFRLPPTDDKQVEVLTTLACDLSDRSTSMVVLYDMSNLIYTQYIADKFIEAIENNKSGGCPSIIFEKRFQPGEGLYVTDEMLRFSPSIVLFAGEGENALQLVRQARALEWGPTFLFTDSGVHPRLSAEITADGPGEVTPRIYATFPSIVEDPADPSFERYGYDAFKLLAKNMFGDGSSLNRRTINKNLKKLKPTDGDEKQEGRVVAIERFGDSVQYAFDKHGNNLKGEFHVWELQPSGQWEKQQ